MSSLVFIISEKALKTLTSKSYDIISVCSKFHASHKLEMATKTKPAAIIQFS